MFCVCDSSAADSGWLVVCLPWLAVCTCLSGLLVSACSWVFHLVPLRIPVVKKREKEKPQSGRTKQHNSHESHAATALTSITVFSRAKAIIRHRQSGKNCPAVQPRLQQYRGY